MNNAPHIPVMIEEVLSALSPQDNEIYVDGTFGAGGYTKAILDHAHCTVIAIDQDPSVEPTAKAFKDQFKDRFHFLPGNFEEMETLLKNAGFSKVHGIVLDLGISSMQIDQAERGFSFKKDGPLDMRMNTAPGQKTAADLINTLEEEEIANILFRYGEERKSRHIAKAIVQHRATQKFTTTTELADIIRSVLAKTHRDKTDPATRSFQGLRIAVNDELGALERTLLASPALLYPQGRLVVVTFHSLEDRIVKTFLREQAGLTQSASRHQPAENTQKQDPTFTLPHRKALAPTDTETQRNPRARSAKLRYAIRTQQEGEGI